MISAMAFGLMACEAPTSVSVLDSPSIDQTLYDGRVINVSERANTTVVLSSLTTGEPNSSEIDIFVVANNTRSAPFNVSTTSFGVTVDGEPAKVFTYEELRAAEIRSRNIALVATALGGAAQAYSASAPQRTTGTYNYGGTMGTFNSTTYNPAAASLASAAATANTNAQMGNISSNSERTLGQLQDTYLKPTTMNRGMEYGGVVRIQVPRLAERTSQNITLAIQLGSDVHRFDMVRSWDPTP